GRCDLGVFRVERAPVRLRQRRLEGYFRRPGARDGHDREDLSEPEISAAAAAAPERVGALRSRRAGRDVSDGLGRPRRRLRRPRPDRRARPRHECEAGGDSMAVRRRAAVRERESWRDAHGNRARITTRATTITKQPLFFWWALWALWFATEDD